MAIAVPMSGRLVPPSPIVSSYLRGSIICVLQQDTRTPTFQNALHSMHFRYLKDIREDAKVDHLRCCYDSHALLVIIV